MGVANIKSYKSYTVPWGGEPFRHMRGGGGFRRQKSVRPKNQYALLRSVSAFTLSVTGIAPLMILCSLINI